jgi:small subunit ribosomal protein S6
MKADGSVGVRTVNMHHIGEGGTGLHDYEMMLILPPDLDDEGSTTATERIRGYVTSRGGDVRSLELWGRRRLAFPLRKYHEGVYHIARFSLAPEQAVDLDRSLRLNEQVLRHLIVRTDE